MTELRKQINNIVEDHQACLILAKSMNGTEVYEGTTATAEDIREGKTAYSNGKLIEGNLIVKDFNIKCDYVYQGWASAESGFQQSVTEIDNVKFATYAPVYAFANLIRLQKASNIDLTGVTNTTAMFSGCKALKDLTLLNTTQLNNMKSMFAEDCTSLSNESLNNILEMCTNSAVTSNKTLKYIGLTSTQAATCQSLSNYAAFIAAGWTTGY